MSSSSVRIGEDSKTRLAWGSYRIIQGSAFPENNLACEFAEFGGWWPSKEQLLLQGKVRQKGVCNASELEWVACNMTRVYFRKLEKVCQGRRQQESFIAVQCECAPWKRCHAWQNILSHIRNRALLCFSAFIHKVLILLQRSKGSWPASRIFCTSILQLS